MTAVAKTAPAAIEDARARRAERLALLTDTANKVEASYDGDSYAFYAWMPNRDLVVVSSEPTWPGSLGFYNTTDATPEGHARAAAWVCERAGLPQPEPRIGSAIQPRPAPVPWTLEHAPAAANDNPPPEDITPPRNGMEAMAPDTDDLTRPGGFVEDVVDWIVASAEHPSRELALSAALTFAGALIGRRFEGYRGCRSNIYAVALAPSGYGKEHARSQIKRLVASAHLHKFSGPARIMSATGLRNLLVDKPSVNLMIDEFGGPLRAMLDPRASSHLAMIKDDMLEYFSTAGTYFDGAAYAQAPAVKIHNPNLCVYGTSTPDAFWSAVTGLQTTDGFLARFLLFDVQAAKPDAVMPTIDVTDVPVALRERAQALASVGRSGNLASPALDCGDREVTVVCPLRSGPP